MVVMVLPHSLSRDVGLWSLRYKRR